VARRRRGQGPSPVRLARRRRHRLGHEDGRGGAEELAGLSPVWRISGEGAQTPRSVQAEHVLAAELPQDPSPRGKNKACTVTRLDLMSFICANYWHGLTSLLEQFFPELGRVMLLDDDVVVRKDLT